MGIIPEPVIRELKILWDYSYIIFAQIFWYWVLGMAIGSVVSVFGKERISKIFAAMQGKKLGILGIFPASILGIASPLCMYGTIPIVAAFHKKGLRQDWIAAFMVSSILLNPQLIIYTAALGLPLLTIRIISCFLCGSFAGILIFLFYKKKQFFKFTAFEKIANKDTDPNPFLRLLKNFARNIKATGLYFLAGILLSALFQSYVPEEAFVNLFGKNREFGLLMATTIGVPLYVCGGGTIPMIQSWLHKGLSMGAAVSFMIAGPAMKITNLGALKIVLGIKHFLFYIIFSVFFSFITGIIINKTY